MRPVHHGDVMAVASALLAVAPHKRRRYLRELFTQADAADAYRRRVGRAHPLWGNGSLMSLARKGGLPPQPGLESDAFCACMAAVFEALVAWRAEKARAVHGCR